MDNYSVTLNEILQKANDLKKNSYMNFTLNKSIHNDELKLRKLNSEINENIKRDYNIELLKKF